MCNAGHGGKISQPTKVHRTTMLQPGLLSNSQCTQNDYLCPSKLVIKIHCYYC